MDEGFQEGQPDVAQPRKRPRLAITLGDPNGIGPEVVLKCLIDARVMKFMQPIVVGSAHVLKVHAQHLGYHEVPIHRIQQVSEPVQKTGVTVLDVTHDNQPSVHFGSVTEEGGRLAMKAVEAATDLCVEGRMDAIVTAPISKEAIAKAGYNAPGHTEFIAQRTCCDAYTMMMVSEKLRVGLVTGHISIGDVPKQITQEAILEKIEIITESLGRNFSVSHPRIAVLGLNPHAGDGGVLGGEEVDTIAPAVQKACQRGHLVFGPYPADGFFAMGDYRSYDAVLAMYHDQGLVPFKTLAFDTGVNFTAGLPIIRTSPDHGTAFNIAGRGQASPGSMRSAIYLAIDIARRRLRAISRKAS